MRRVRAGVWHAELGGAGAAELPAGMVSAHGEPGQLEEDILPDRKGDPGLEEAH